MLSISAISDSNGAGHYFSRDDYYCKQDPLVAGQWHGLAAARLGLSLKTVELNQFKSMLDGKLPNGVELCKSNGDHKPGWDLTLSAPKSVSIMALAGGDERLFAAHDRAVQQAMQYAERHAALTRIKEDGVTRKVHTGNLIWASFQHESNREQEPQLHTHSVLLNATFTKEKWRSLESREIYQIQKVIGEVYRTELAKEVQSLGYQIERKHQDGRFEIVGVSQELIDKFSERSRQIEEYLRKHNLENTPENREKAALHTRKKKEDIPREELRQRWQEEAREYNLSNLISQSKNQKNIIQNGQDEAKKSLRFAIESLSERECRFSHHQLIQESMRHGFGRISIQNLEFQILKEVKSGNLIQREMPDGRYGYTTPELIKIEKQNIAMMRSDQGKLEALMSKEKADEVVLLASLESSKKGYSWTLGQRNAVLDILTSKDKVQGIQGYAGTAKTSTVLATVAREYHSRGYQVHLMAPTASATKQLSDAIGPNQTNSCTVQKFLIDQQRQTQDSQDSNKQVWIVDEASMLGAKQMNQLLKHAERQDAKVILVGDTRQIASIEAGKAFGQLQQAGMQCSVLDHIVRQKNYDLKHSVELAAQGKMKNALERVESAGGLFEAVGEDKSSEMVRMAATKYLLMSVSDQEREKTLVIATSRAARDELNSQIREGLKKQNVLSEQEVRLESLAPVGWTKAEMRHAANYIQSQNATQEVQGQLIVRFGRGYKSLQVEKGEYGRVAGGEDGKIKLVMQDGREILWNPNRQTKIEVFEAQEKGLSQGDLIRWTRNDNELGLRNGEIAKIQEIQNDGIAKVQLASGETKELNLNEQKHWDHGYATTIFSSQGRTCKHVIAVMPSNSPLSHQKTAYVAISRAKESAFIFTDSKDRLIAALEQRTGEKTTALDMSQQKQKEQEKTTQKTKITKTELQQTISTLLRDYAREKKEIHDTGKGFEHYQNADYKFLSSITKAIETHKVDKSAADFSKVVNTFIKDINAGKVEDKNKAWKEFRSELKSLCNKKGFSNTRVQEIERPNWFKEQRNYIDQQLNKYTTLQNQVGGLIKQYQQQKKDIYLKYKDLEDKKAMWSEYQKLNVNFMENLIKSTQIHKGDKTVGAFTEKIDNYIKNMNKDYWNITAKERGENWKEFVKDLQSLSSSTFAVIKNVKEIETPRWLKTDWQQEVYKSVREYFQNKTEINKNMIQFYKEYGNGNKIEAIKNNAGQYSKIRYETNDKLEKNEEQLITKLTLLSYRNVENPIDKNLKNELAQAVKEYQAKKEWLDSLRSSIAPDMPEHKKAILRQFVAEQYRENLDNLLSKAYFLAGPDKKQSAWQRIVGVEQRLEHGQGQDYQGKDIDSIVNRKIEEMSFSKAVGVTLDQFRWEQRQTLKQMAEFYQQYGNGDKFLAIRNATEEYKVLRGQVNSELEAIEAQFTDKLKQLVENHPDQSVESQAMRKALVNAIERYEADKGRLDEMKQGLVSGRIALTEEEKAMARQEIAQEYRQIQNEFLSQVRDISEGKVQAQEQGIKAERGEQTKTEQTQTQTTGHDQSQSQEQSRTRSRGRGR